MISFDTGLSALRAAQQAMQVVGQNVANADTEGYSRQRTILESIGPAGGAGPRVGRGVQVSEVRREADDLLVGRLRTESSVEGRLESLATRLAEIEALFGEPGDTSLGSMLNGFFDRLSDLATDAGDPTLRTQALRAAEDLALAFRSLAGRLESVRRDVRPEIESRMYEVNEAARIVADLNRQISAAQLRGDPANELHDQRDRLLQDIARELDVQVLSDASGGVSVLASGHLLVSGTRAHSLELAPSEGGVARLRLAGSSEGFAPTGGALRGLTEIEGSTVPGLLDRLDSLARSLAYEVNRAHARGVGLQGSFTSLVAAHGGDPDRPLAEAGLPFAPTAGPLVVSVVDQVTGAVRRTRLDLDPARQGLRDVASALDAIDGLRASLDPSGRLRLQATPGYAFDFSDRVVPDPGDLGGSSLTLAGRYAGSSNDTITLRAAGTGRVGVTDGLEVEVRAEDGSLLRTLSVGRGYAPGDPLEVAPGVTVRLGSGDLTAGDERSVELIADPDPGGFLPALGLNVLFAGGSAAELQVSSDLIGNPDRLATGLGGSPGDNGVLLDVLALRDERLEDLGGTLGEFYGLLVGEVGQQRRSTETLRENEAGLVRALEARREEVAGVSVDEEMVELLRYQRGFEAAARFIATISEVTQMLVSLR